MNDRLLQGFRPVSQFLLSKHTAEPSARCYKQSGRHWRMVGAGEWQSLENGRRWRMVVAGEW